MSFSYYRIHDEKNQMKIIFESQIYPDSLIEEMKDLSKGGLDIAAHNLCKAIYTGLLLNNQEVHLINVPNLGSFPMLFKRPRVPGTKMEHGRSLAFWNVTVFKRIDIRVRIKHELNRLLKNCNNESKTILLIYNFRTLPLLTKVKKDNPSLKIVMVVTDLPEFMLKPTGMLFKLGDKLLKHKETDELEGFKAIDGFVLLAPAMSDKIPVGGKPWIQIEGIFNSDTLVEKQEKNDEKTILYSGDLGLRYGILDLLEAFHIIHDDSYRLWICGDGEGREEVIKYSKADRRIDYKGILSRKEVLSLQQRATILVNPRKSTDEYTKYSFPSKTMEYLASGTPVVMSHLQSFPQEYSPYIYYLEDESIYGLRSKIQEVCSKPRLELDEFGSKAAEFILEQKTPIPQMKKVIEFIKTL